MQDKRSIGSTIARLRMETGLKQNKLSTILSMSPSNVSNYEHEVYWPDLGTLCKIADLFHVTTDYLLCRTDLRYSPEVLEKYFSADPSFCSILNTLLALDMASLDAVARYADFLKDSQVRSS